MLRRVVLNVQIHIVAIVSVVSKTGDDGKSRWNNRVVDKDSPLLEAVGTLDELQAWVDDEDIQKDLWSIMGEMAYGVESESIKSKVKRLEQEIVKIENKLKPINEFLIFKNEEAKNINIARTVCRRAERRLVTLNKTTSINSDILIYINRLSDYLFMLARSIE